MRKGKHFIQSHRLHKNVTVETECAFRTPKAARIAAPPEAKRARSARFAPPPRLKLPRFARPVKQKQRTNDLKPQCSDLRNILLTGFVGAKLGRTLGPGPLSEYLTHFEILEIQFFSNSPNGYAHWNRTALLSRCVWTV